MPPVFSANLFRTFFLLVSNLWPTAFTNGSRCVSMFWTQIMLLPDQRMLTRWKVGVKSSFFARFFKFSACSQLKEIRSFKILPPKIQPLPKNQANPGMKRISFEGERQKVCSGHIFSKKINNFAFNFVYYSIAMCVWHPRWHGRAKTYSNYSLQWPPNSNVLISFGSVLGTWKELEFNLTPIKYFKSWRRSKKLCLWRYECCAMWKSCKTL